MYIRYINKKIFFFLELSTCGTSLLFSLIFTDSNTLYIPFFTISFIFLIISIYHGEFKILFLSLTGLTNYSKLFYLIFSFINFISYFLLHAFLLITKNNYISCILITIISCAFINFFIHPKSINK